MRKFTILIMALLATVTISGCGDVKIFKEHVDPNVLTPLKDSELVNDTYYVKNNTRFYAVHASKLGNAQSGTTSLNESRVFVTMDDDTLIPTYYSDELIAFQSNKIGFNTATLERFEDYGYSIGCFNGTHTDEGYLHFDKQNNIVQDSSFYNIIGDTEATDIRIESIDGKALSSDQIASEAGIITGLEKDKSYKIGYYVGTKYLESSVIADCHMYGAIEMYSYGKEAISDTENGYQSFTMPSDLKCGYYNINGAGMFKFYNFARGTQNESNIKMNESFYKDEKCKIEAYSRQYNVSIPKRVKNLKITITYTNPTDSSSSSSDSENVQGIAFAPDGTRLDMTVDKGKSEITMSLAEGMAGDWTLNIVPKTLNIVDVVVDKDTIEEEATCEETTFTVTDSKENVQFIAYYTGLSEDMTKCTVFGTILAPDGKTTYEMTCGSTNTDPKKYYIAYEVPHLSAGTYKVRIYHYPEETTIEKPTMQDETEKKTDVIVVDG